MIRYTESKQAFKLKVIPNPWRVIFTRVNNKETAQEVDKKTARAFISLLSSDDIAQRIVERAEAE